MDEMDKKAIGLVTYWLKKRIGMIPAFSVEILTKMKVFGNIEYYLKTNLADTNLYKVSYDGLRQIWYLVCYNGFESVKYMDDTVRAEIMRKVENDLSK